MKSHFSQSGLKLTIVLTVLVFFAHSAPAAGDPCKEGKKSLSGDYEVLQTKGGLWGYMEQTAGLKEKSTMGLVADSKLQRAIVIFDAMCDSNKKPDQDMYSKIQKQITTASSIHGKVGKTSVADIIASIEALNKSLDELLKTIEIK
jgi:hypothetical protein